MVSSIAATVVVINAESPTTFAPCSLAAATTVSTGTSLPKSITL